MSTKRWTMAAALGLAACAAAASCAEAGNGNGLTTGGGAGGSTGSETTSTGATTSSGATNTTTSGTGSSAGGMVINEISAKGEDWIELANAGSSPVDIGNWGLCDDVSADAGSDCDLATVVRFPQGTMVQPGEYVLVVGNEPVDAGTGPHMTCLKSGGPTTCYYATWKVSASNGETVHLIDPANKPVDEELYPMNAVPSGQTWGRLPDKTGAFAPNKPTPGAANMGP